MRWVSCRARSTSCRISREVKPPITLEKLVRVYRRFHQPAARAELAYYGSLPTLREAIGRAGRAERPDGKRHDHQTRIRRRALAEAANRLKRLPLTGARRFHDLHSAIDQALGSIDGIGELMVYDTSLRIGARLKLAPDVIYLHRGTRAGAKALGLNPRAAFIHPNEVPTPLRGLRPHELEDFLCIFKAEIARWAA
jgi:hypothetical protein